VDHGLLDGILDVSRPPPSALMSWTIAVICCNRTFTAVRWLERSVLWAVMTNTVPRWESGRNVQTAAMDMLLRLIPDLPGSIDYLRDHHPV